MNVKTGTAVAVTVLVSLLAAPAFAAHGDLERMVDERIARYARAFPEIGFMRLGGEHHVDALTRLLGVLGRRATSVDYEHRDESRGLLVDLQVHRIGLMMQSRSPSATLFDLGPDSLFPHPLVCVITLDTKPFERDASAAARFLDIADTVATHGPVNNREFLRFTVDHEIFHCLDAYANGPMFLMGSSDAQRLNEQQGAETRADYYAALSHLAEGGDWQLLRHMLVARKRGMDTGDHAHYTEPALVAALAADPSPVRRLSLRNRARLAYQR